MPLHPSSFSLSWQFASLAALLALPALYYIVTSLRSGLFSSKTPPGSLGLPILGENIAFFKAFNKPLGIYEFLIPRYKKYGNPFKTNVLGLVTVFASGGETGKFIFTNEDKLFNLATNKSMQDLIGHNSIFEARGELHRQMRRTMGEPVSMDSLKRHLNGIEDVALRVLNRWKDNTRVCVLDETTDFAFQIISYILISSKPGLEQDQMKKYFHEATQALVSLPLNIPGLAYHRGIKARLKLQKMLDKIIAERRNGSQYHEDFLQSMLDKGAHSDGKLSDLELKDNLMAILFAGHETSATALMWAMKFILENPSVENNLFMEHSAIQSKKGLDSHLTWEEVRSMSYMNKVINEALRTANIARLLPRIVLQDTEIDGCIVKKGWRVILDTQAPHFDASHFIEPHQFNPSRFDEAPKSYTFMPFGGGPRMCLGMNLARVEMIVFLHHLITKYRWKAFNSDNTLAPTLLPKLKDGYPIEVMART